MAQTPPYQALKEAPKEIRRASTVAQVCSSFTRALGILFATIIIATLPTWVPGLLALQPLPITLLALTIGCNVVSAKGSRIRERIASRDFERARGSSLSAAILGFLFAGVIPGILYVYLYSRIGSVMVKRRPDDPTTIYLLPHPSEGMFLGRYLGWIAAYVLVLYIGYTQLPPGLRGVSDWLSPVFGVHFNTLIVATYLIFTNPLTYPPLFQLWLTAGLLGGLIAGGKVGRGFTVGLAVFLSTLGAMGLASLSMVRNLTLGSFSSIPPPPPGFSLVGATTGPVAGDLIPIFIRASSPLDPSLLQDLVLTLVRNAGLVLTIVTISGRAASLLWQGGVNLAKLVLVSKPRHPVLKNDHTILNRPALKSAILLLALALFLPIPHSHIPSSINQASMPGHYQQNLAVALDMLGSPNASLRLTNLDLSSRGLVLDNNYAGSNMSMFVVNNNFSQAFGSGPQTTILQLVSQPALVTYYTGNPKVTSIESDGVAAQFSKALGVPFTIAFSIPTGQGSITVYAPSPELSNYDALTRVLALLPSSSFARLVNTTNIQKLEYFAALGLLPPINGASIHAFSFDLSIQWPRLFYKAGPHQLSLKSLLGFQNSITGDAAANVSIISMAFQRGTILYSSLWPNPFYNNYTSTYYLNATSGSWSDFVARFTYPFAPNIVIEKRVSPASGPVGTIHNIVLTIQNVDSVTVTNINVTDPQASPSYSSTLTTSSNGVQTLQASTLSPGITRTLNYTLTTQSSGIYSLAPATVAFLWTAPNGTTIRYSISTDPRQITSLSGPWTQFTKTFNDLLPYSLLLLIPLLLTPVIETFRLVTRRSKRRRETEKQAVLAAKPPEPPPTVPKSPNTGSGTNPPPTTQ